MSVSRDIAKQIARDIFKCGDELNSPCNRIQFMGGEYLVNERSQGGSSEIGLINLIEESLSKIFTKEPH